MINIIICPNDRFKDKQGIHVFGADLWYLNDALETASRDQFETIFLHYDVVGCTNYVINSDVLNRLYALNKLKGYGVNFNHAASTKIIHFEE